MMSARTWASICVAAAAALALAAPARADSVLQSGIVSKGKIIGIGQEGLLLDWDQGGKKAYALANVKKISVDGENELNAAEDFYAAGDAKRATALYETAKIKAKQPWIKEFVNARLVDCYGKVQQFARAVKLYVELCQGNSNLLPWIQVPPVLPKGNRDNDTALDAVQSALKAAPTASYAERLQKLQMDILLVQGDPAQVLEMVERQLDNPDPERRQQARLKHVELLLNLGKVQEAGESLKLAKQKFDPQYEKQILYLEAQYLYATKDHLHAALAFMRTAILYPRDKNLAAMALYRAGKSMCDSKAVPPEEVASPLREAVSKFPGTEGAAQAQKLLDELQAGK